ncbi:MAG: YkvI family membrane protein [Cellulosilyticaceae bacterium]
MKCNYRAILQVASVYIGTVIGAGFASGQEMITFFTKYGLSGVIGLILAGIAYAVLGAVILEVVYERQFSNYKDLLKDVMGPKLSLVLEWTVNIFLFICFSTMIAGAGAIMKQAFDVPYWIGACGMAVACVATFLTGAKGFVGMNALLVPFMCIGGLILGVYVILFRDVSAFAHSGMGTPDRHWFVSMILYVSYNMLTVIVVLCTLYDQLKNKKVARWGGILGGIGLGVLGLSIGLSTLIYYDQIKNLEIPMLGVLVNYTHFIQTIYLVVLVLAMYTTAIANGYGVLQNLKARIKVNDKLLIVLTTIMAMMAAKMGFSNLVSKVFPVFGYVGLFEIIMILVYYSCMKWEHRRK